jgi:serine/threonine protein phosphatase PrpC
MQDAVQVLPALEVASGAAELRLAYAAVLDGHGGAQASTYARDHLHTHLQTALARTLAPGRTDAAVREALTAAFKETDRAFLARAAEHGWRDGACALVALLVDDALYVANLGDCKAVLGRVLRRRGRRFAWLGAC